MRRDGIKGESGGNGGQNRMEGNMVSLIQHDYYGSHLQNYTDLAYIELLAFQREGMGREGGKEVGTQSFRNNCRVLFLPSTRKQEIQVEGYRKLFGPTGQKRRWRQGQRGMIEERADW